MLNLFGSISSVKYQFLVLGSPFIQMIFMKKDAKNPLFEGWCYNLKGLEFFSKMNFESSWVLRGWKFDRLCILCYHFGFWHQLFVHPALTSELLGQWVCMSVCYLLFAHPKLQSELSWKFKDLFLRIPIKTISFLFLWNFSSI